MRQWTTLFALGLLAGCASTYRQEVMIAPSAKLQTGKSVLIATPSNGKYEAQEYRESGSTTAGAIRAAFVRHTNKADISTSCSDLECLRRSGGAADYYVVPMILHWEDRNTEWSGKKDRLEVKVSVFDGNGNDLATTIITGSSKWMTFGGDHPQDLLPVPLGAYVDSLYR